MDAASTSLGSARSPYDDHNIWQIAHGSSIATSSHPSFGIDTCSSRLMSFLITPSGLSSMLLLATATNVRIKHWNCTCPRCPGPRSVAQMDSRDPCPCVVGAAAFAAGGGLLATVLRSHQAGVGQSVRQRSGQGRYSDSTPNTVHFSSHDSRFRRGGAE